MTKLAPQKARRLGPHHFAHLRAVAEGLPVADAARRYLVIEHGAQIRAAHDLVVDQVRAIARRRGDPRWRLVGIDIHDAAKSGAALPPPLHEWAEAEGLDGWSEAELQEMYADRFGHADPVQRRRSARNARLRVRRLELLRELEAAAAEAPQPSDLVEGWYSRPVADQLRQCGVLTLQDLQKRISRGGWWWGSLKGVGPLKAARLASYLVVLLGPIKPAPTSWSISGPASPENSRDLSGRAGINRAAGAVAGTDAQDDLQAIERWVAARSGSAETSRQFQREGERFLLWCLRERGKALSDAVAEDCRAYINFLADIPEAWISRRKVPRLAPGWAPFKGQLSIASQAAAIDKLHALFTWLVKTQYLAGNPWLLVNRRIGDDADNDVDPTSRAFTPAAWSALLAHLDAQPPTPSTLRMRWICRFVECTGLRADELLAARRAHLRQQTGHWIIRVHGKGRRNRVVPVPAVAMAATRRYFAVRGLDFDSATEETPLLASLVTPEEGIGYQALRETFTRFVRKAIGASNLPADERARALQGSAHWLRHTHATRAAEAKVPPDVLQENMGHSDPRTTARYYRAQLARRQAAMEKAFPSE